MPDVSGGGSGLIATAVDIALEHRAWLIGKNRGSQAHHFIVIADLMEAIGRPQIMARNRAGSSDIRIAALAAAWLALPDRGRG